MQTRELRDKTKLTRTELVVILLASIVTITFVSTCSPLYPFNPWDDTNCFFTLGRGIKHGLVPYRDLYEQKGPLLYFLYAIAALISDKSFIGAWIIECIAASVFAVFSWKIVKLFTEPSKYSIALMPLFLGIIYTIRMFNFGGNAEELCFPLLTLALYIGLRSIVKGDGLPSKKDAIYCGLITGVLFWIKYTFVGFMMGFILYIIVLTVKRRSFVRLWSLVWRFIIGFFFLSVSVLFYFLVTDSVDSLFEVYFYNNIVYYHTEELTSGILNAPIIKNVFNAGASTLITSFNYPSFGIMLLLTFISLAFIGKKYRKKSVLLFAVTFMLSAGMIFTRAAFIYYYGYLLVYSFCLVLIPCVKGINYLEKQYKDHSGFILGVLSGALLVLYALSIFLCKNMYLIFKPKEVLVQYRFAEIIDQTPGAKVLTYDVMDAGFYTAAGILPSNRYFCYLNIEKSHPAILEEQDRLIAEGYYDYIVTSFFCECEWDNYELISEETTDYVDYSGEQCLDGERLYKRIG